MTAATDVIKQETNSNDGNDGRKRGKYIFCDQVTRDGTKINNKSCGARYFDQQKKSVHS